MQKLIEKNLYNRSLLSYLLLPFSLLFSGLVILRRKFHPTGYRSRCQVISVGNIVSGGSGKTPVTIFLAKYLFNNGKKIAVSHRGYKGKFEKENRLISDQNQVFDFAREAGDEAFLLASKLKGIPVIAGKDRKLSIKILEEKFPELEYIILDDSFQNLKVLHDFDFVVFNSIGNIGNGFVLPAGILREPLSALNYCDALVYNGTNEIPSNLQKYDKPILKGHYTIKRFYDIEQKDIAVSKLHNKKTALLSGIGKPASFEKTIRKAEINFEKHFAFPDHYNFTDFNQLKHLQDYDYIITTEKDFAKLQSIEHNLSLVVTEIKFELFDETELIDSLIQKPMN